MQFAGKGLDERGREELFFDRKVNDAAWTSRLALVDEHGTVNEELGGHLMATGCRAVAVGDPLQLKPVRGQRYFNGADFRLTHVHRQALESPIIRQLHALRRTGGYYGPDTDDFRVQRFVDRDDILGCDVLLCWRNETRKRLNALKRAHMGIDPREMPLPGEPVMCLKNDHEMGIMNGAVYPLVRFDHGEGWCSVTVNNEYGRPVEVDAWVEDLHEAGKDDPSGGRSRFDEPIGFALGYCATVHKAQGAEYNIPIIVDEYTKREERMEWINTAISRAVKRILMQRDW